MTTHPSGEPSCAQTSAGLFVPSLELEESIQGTKKIEAEQQKNYENISYGYGSYILVIS